MLNTEIRQFNTNYLFRMQVVYNTKSDCWVLSFASMCPRHSREEEHICKSFMDALERFNKNCRYYGVPEQYCTEEQFLGLKKGTLYPSARTSTTSNGSVYKEAR